MIPEGMSWTEAWFIGRSEGPHLRLIRGGKLRLSSVGGRSNPIAKAGGA